MSGQVVDPWYAANIFFMCLRHADAEQNRESVEFLFAHLLLSVEQLVAHSSVVRMLAFWMSNLMHLIDCIKLYSSQGTDTPDIPVGILIPRSPPFLNPKTLQCRQQKKCVPTNHNVNLNQ